MVIITALLNFTELESHNEINDKFFCLFCTFKILGTEIQLLNTGCKKKGGEGKKSGVTSFGLCFFF